MIAGRVIMLSRDQGLASIAGRLVGHGRPLTCFTSPAEVRDWLRPPTGAVVLDFPRAARGIVYQQLRRRYLGPVLALLEPDEDSSGLTTDYGRVGVLHRPFTGEELSASLDALVGSRNGAARSRSRSLTVPPVGTDATAMAAADTAALPAARVTSRDLAESSGRRRHPRPIARRRVSGLVLALAGTAALLLAAALGDGGGGCRAAGCRNLVGAVENGATSTLPVSPMPAIPRPVPAPATGSAKGPPASPPAVGPPQGPRMVIPIASGVRDLITGTSSSSGGAPLLKVTTGSGSPPPSGGSTAGSGGVPSSTTQPPATTAPPTTAATATTSPPATTAPPTTEPATTAPTTTEPATTAPTTTEPATTAPTTTEPPTTAPPTTGTATSAATPSASETTPTS